MIKAIRVYLLAVFYGVAVSAAVNAATVTVPVSSSDTAAWSRSDGGTGTTMVQGGPAIWNATFTTTIPAGATNISFTLDTFFADDKGVMQLNGTTIADAVVQRPNGTAAGAGTFDFGLGGGNLPYTFVGFTPGTAFPLVNGTTTMTLIVYMNDTSTTDPAAPPLPQTFISSFQMTGTLTYDQAIAASLTTLQTSGSPSLFGQPVTFTATVTGNSPTGTVQFFDGAVPLGGPVTLAGGVAAVTTSSLSQGSHVVTAVYSGDANNTPSTSSTITQFVNAVVAQEPARQVPTLSGMLLLVLSGLLGLFASAGYLRRKR